MKRKLSRTERTRFFLSGIAVLILISFALPAIFLITISKYHSERRKESRIY
jgi:hypothetical protein